ncbi:hypothetical protein [Mesorhizobium sp. Root172]|uniref:hypothetical protein n=1 Tax=Mesorhizobium sp. Root172 TaxID=1736481 RepID=UPI0006F7EB3E|nr:hypothetical protein [Mesorhizobium sp. Root172]KRB22669.1 hypothetical protein ASE05_15910 [Mesorhizobium sp. Root172]
MTSIQIDIKDGLSSSTAIKGPCRVTTTANIALVGEQTIDGVAVVTGDRVLVKDQTTASDNGIWICDTGNWRRSKDFNKTKDVVKGTQILITSGTLYASSGWYLSSPDPISIGSSNLVLTQNVLLNAAQLIALEAAAEASANAAVAAETAAETAQGGAEDARDEALAAALAANGTVPVANRTALKALSTPTKKTAIIYAEGGRNGTFAFTSGDLSALVTSDPLEGIYVAPASAPTGASGAWVRLAGWLVQGADARWWGATNDYNPTTKAGTSIHTAVNAAFAVVPWVVLPAGPMLLSDKITLDATGLNPKKLTGADRRSSLVYMNSGFNLAATAALNLTGTPSNDTELHTLRNFTVICQDQPDDPNIANYVHYPPVISCVDQSNVNFSKLHIREAYIGIDMTGNCGGMDMSDIELSAYFKGIKVDGSTNSVKIDKLMWWPYGFPQTANKRAVYATARGLEMFRCDDFHLSNSLMFGSTQALYMSSSGLGSTFGTAVNVDFDDRGGLVMTAGALFASSCYFTLGKTDSQLVNQSGGVLAITSSQFGVAAQSAIGKAIQITGGEFQLTGSHVNCGNFDDNIISATNASSVMIGGNKFVRTDAITYANPVIIASGTGLRATIVGNQANTFASGSSEFVRIGGSMSGVVAHNDTPFSGAVGWTYTGNQLLPNVIFANNTGRNGNRSETISVLAADRAGADVATVQNVFASTEDELTVDAETTYEFEAQYMLSRAAGTTSHTFATLFGGTATITTIDYIAEISNPTGDVLSALQSLHVTAATAAVLTAANTSATEYIICKLRGVFRVSTAGTVIPQFQYSAAPGGAPTIKRNSFFKVKPIGLRTMVANGAWS